MNGFLTGQVRPWHVSRPIQWTLDVQDTGRMVDFWSEAARL